MGALLLPLLNYKGCEKMKLEIIASNDLIQKYNRAVEKGAR